MTLYELSVPARELYELLQNDEIDEQTFKDTLEAIGAEDKVESYCRIIRQMEADIKTEIDAKIEVLEEEKARLLGVKESKQKNIDKMKESLLQFIDACGGEKIRGKTFTAYPRRTESIEYDERMIPKEFYTTVEKLDKNAVKEALNKGIEIDGVKKIVTRKVMIR